MSIIDWLRDDPARSALAGGAGGLIRWVSLKEDWRSGLVSILVGTISAIYLGPLVLPLLEPILGKLVVDGSALAGLAGFIVGLAGTSFTGWVMAVLKAAQTRVGGDRGEPNGKSDGQ